MSVRPSARGSVSPRGAWPSRATTMGGTPATPVFSERWRMTFSTVPRIRTWYETVRAAGLGGVLAELGDLERAPGAHHADLVADLHAAVHHADVDDHAAVVVVFGVEDEGAGLRDNGVARRGELLADGGEKFLDALAGL